MGPSTTSISLIVPSQIQAATRQVSHCKWTATISRRITPFGWMSCLLRAGKIFGIPTQVGTKCAGCPDRRRIRSSYRLRSYRHKGASLALKWQTIHLGFKWAIVRSNLSKLSGFVKNALSGKSTNWFAASWEMLPLMAMTGVGGWVERAQSITSNPPQL